MGFLYDTQQISNFVENYAEKLGTVVDEKNTIKKIEIEKEQKKQLKKELYDFFYNYYNKYKGDITSRNIYAIFHFFNTQENKIEVIERIGKNQSEIDFLKEIYFFENKKVFDEFKTYEISKIMTMTPTERLAYNQAVEARLLIQSGTLGLLDAVRKNNEENEKKIEHTKRKNKNKNGFIVFLNILFSLWN